MMSEPTRPPSAESPRGQAVIIVALSMVVLLAIAALVVDLGLSWMLRRQEQNAADPAAIAAARYIEEGDYDAMVGAACFYAQHNGFFEGDTPDCDASADPVNGPLQVLWPPSGPHAGEFAGRPEMVLVVIHGEHPSFFGRIFGQSVATVATGAVAARESESANSNSLVALDPDSCDAGKIHGGGTVIVEPVDNPETGDPYSGGYVHVNSSCAGGAFNDDCGSGNGAFHLAGSGGAVLNAPHLYVHGTCQESGGTVNVPVTEGAPQIGDPLSSLEGPRQEEYPAGRCLNNKNVYVLMTPSSNGCAVTNKTITMTPGVYWGGWNFKSNGTKVTLEPGIYIIAGGGISLAAGATIDTVADASGDPARVLIFSTDNTMDAACAPELAKARNGQTDYLARCVQGAIKLAGNGSVEMWGLSSGPWRGLLMWQDGDGSNPTAPLEITGNGALNLAGTIYAPLANVKIDGNGNAVGGVRLAVQIISWTWDVGGQGNLYMPYDPSQLYHVTQRGLVH